MYQIYTKKGCGFCEALKQALEKEDVKYVEVIDMGNRFNRHPVMLDLEGNIIFSGLPHYKLLNERITKDKNKQIQPERERAS